MRRLGLLVGVALVVEGLGFLVFGDALVRRHVRQSAERKLTYPRTDTVPPRTLGWLLLIVGIVSLGSWLFR